MALALQEAPPFEVDGVRVVVPAYMTEIVATLSHLARSSAHINQRSGVSVRFTITNHEVMVANAARRALRHGESEVAPRVSDLEALPASMMGKIEIESLEEGRDGLIAENLVKAAVLTVFKDRFSPERFRPIVTAFEEGAIIHAGEDVTSAEYVALLEAQPALREAVTELTEGDSSAASVASAVELLLEGLHLSKRLNKESIGARSTYRARA